MKFAINDDHFKAERWPDIARPLWATLSGQKRRELSNGDKGFTGSMK
jgi:hypothetical protein